MHLGGELAAARTEGEPRSPGVVLLAGCSGEGFLGHLVVGTPLENEDLDAQKRSGREFQAGEQAE